MRFLIVFLLLFATQGAVAIPVDLIVAKQAEPLAPRGGVLMVQLIAEQNGNLWPRKLDVVFEGGIIREGFVGWVDKNQNTSWTSNPYVIRPITEKDNTLLLDPKDSSIGPVLLVELPIRGDGSITFGGNTIEPNWIDLPILSNDTINYSLNIPETGIHLPEWNPLEYWRWNLVSSHNNLLTPPPSFRTEVERLAALHGFYLWQLGFDRLTKCNSIAANKCKHLLTNTAVDGSYVFACWIVKPSSIHHLLSILLDMKSSSKQLVKRVSWWVKEQQPYIYWLENVYGEYAEVTIANPTSEPFIASILWKGEKDPSVSVEVDKRQTVRVPISRPILLDLSLFGPTNPESQVQLLSVEFPNQIYNLPIVPPIVTVEPPYIQFKTLHPLWNLQNIQLGVPTIVHPNNRTSVQLRKVFGNWELFVRCKGLSKNSSLPDSIRSIPHLRGIEAVSILHPDTNTIASISPTDQNVPDEMVIHRTTQDDEWIVRIILPENWTSTGLLSFSVVRTHGDSQHVETAPLPCVPWNIQPAPIVVDLTRWDEVARFPAPSN